MKHVFTRDISAYKTTFLLYGVLFAIAFGARLFFLYALKTVFIFFKYIVFATQLARGQDIGERLLDVSPFYLSFMTLLIKHFHPDHFVIVFLQLMIGVMNCLLIFTIGRVIWHDRIAFVGALLYALYGNIIVQEGTFEPVVFEMFFNLLTVVCLLQIKRAQNMGVRWLWIVLAGVGMGLGILTKPNIILFLPFGMLWLLLPENGALTRRQRASLVAGFVLIAAAVVSPVTIRNYLKLHDFVLVTADYGKVFFHGNARGADGFNSAFLPNQDVDPTGNNDPDYAHVTFRVVAAQALGRPVRPSEAARFWLAVTLRDMAERPWDALQLEFKKALLFFHAHEMFLVAHAFWEYKKSLSYPFVRYSLISAFAVLGMALAVRQWKHLLLLYSAIVSLFISCVLLLVTSRYRSPAAPYLCLFAGYAIVSMAQWLFTRQYRRAILSVLALTFLFAAITLPFRQEITKVEQSMERIFRNSIQPRTFEPLTTPALP